MFWAFVFRPVVVVVAEVPRSAGFYPLVASPAVDISLLDADIPYFSELLMCCAIPAQPGDLSFRQVSTSFFDLGNVGEGFLDTWKVIIAMSLIGNPPPYRLVSALRRHAWRQQRITDGADVGAVGRATRAPPPACPELDIVDAMVGSDRRSQVAVATLAEHDAHGSTSSSTRTNCTHASRAPAQRCWTVVVNPTT
jgi:hypothetical protein